MRLPKEFYTRDVLLVTQELLGKTLVRKFSDGTEFRDVITEVEAYGGEEDLASHARFGKTDRNKLMYEDGGLIYVYLIYGMYWMLNFTAGTKENPQAVLIRGTKNFSGPGRLGRELKLDKTFYGEEVAESTRLWVEDLPTQNKIKITKSKRIGVGYAGKWADKKWRFQASNL